MTKKDKPMVVLAAGGTGGHVFPAQALAAELSGRDYGVALLTDRRGEDFGEAFKDVDIHRIHAGGLAGKGLGARLSSAAKMAWGLVQARGLMKTLKPDVVVGFGGYASVPTMMAATGMNIKTVIHEQNAVLGRANRLLASRVNRIATSFENSEGLTPENAGKAVHTGMPVRPAIAAMRGRPYPSLDGDGPVNLLVLGGSQGARVLSQVIPNAIGLLPKELRDRLHITQQCRPEDLAGVEALYSALDIKVDLSAFFTDIPERFAAAHLLISRSGASTVAEQTAIGRPAVLIPYPHAIDDHQSRNAHAVDEVGGGWLMPEEALSAEALAARLDSLFGLPAILEKAATAALKAGRPDAAARLADLVTSLVPNGSQGEAPDRRAA